MTTGNDDGNDIGVWHRVGQVFLKVADVFFNGAGNLDKGANKDKFSGQLYGYGGNQTGVYRYNTLHYTT